jgi:hypothetical protein
MQRPLLLSCKETYRMSSTSVSMLLLSLILTGLLSVQLQANTNYGQGAPPLLSYYQAQDTVPQELQTDVPEPEIEVIPGTITQVIENDDEEVATDTTEAEAATPVLPEQTFSGPYTRTELLKGERLFKGLLAFRSGLHDCASCHYTKRTDTLNWNPSAYDIAVLWKENDGYSIREKLENPLGMRMMSDHAGMTITLAEERQLEAYFEKVISDGPGDLQAIPVNAVIFWGLGFLMALALIDLLITKKIKPKAFHLLVIIAGLVVHMQYALAEGQALGRTQGYAPDQPIKFSHLIHAGEHEIDCNYCHTISSFSLSAGIPSNNTCMNCHGVIREGTNSGRFEINKIHQAEASGNPVRWIRIHKLPDHSFFSHAQHINAGKLECQDCHGQVEEMHIVRQVEDLSMGWCLTCHRDQEVDFLGNPYYSIYERLHDDIRAGRIDAVTAARVGGEDCMKCHY